MNRPLRDWVIAAVQLGLGGILLGQSLLLAFWERAIQGFAQYGYPDWVRLLLAWSEISAATLFLIPRTFWIGAWLLLMVLVGAAGLHLVLAENPSILFVYLLLLVLIMAYRRGRGQSPTAVT